MADDTMTKVWEMAVFPDKGERIDVRLDTELSGRSGAFGRAYYLYRLTVDGKTVFEGDDYGASPSHAPKGGWPDALPARAVYSLLDFLTMKPGDVDSDYFENYTPEQIAFAQGDVADEVSMACRRAEDAVNGASDLEAALEKAGVPAPGMKAKVLADGEMGVSFTFPDGLVVRCEGYDPETDDVHWLVDGAPVPTGTADTVRLLAER